MGRAQFAVVLVVVAVGGLVGGALSDRLKGRPVYAQEGGAAGKVVETQEFRIVDAEGRTRAVVGLDADGISGLTLIDAAGQVRCSLGYLAGGTSALALTDTEGKVRAYVGLEANGSPRLTFSDDAGLGRLALGVDRGLSGLGVMDDAGDVRAYVSLQPDGTSLLAVADPTGKATASLEVSPLALCDQAGKPRVHIGPDNPGAWGVRLLDPDGGLLWGSP
jgi:hypothetical protein